MSFLPRNFGSDPEFFLTNRSYNDSNFYTNPSIYPPAAFFLDFKIEPKKTKNGKRIIFSYEDMDVIEDGAAAEINFRKPFNSVIECYSMYSSIRNAFEDFVGGRGNICVSNAVTGFFDTKKYWEGRDESFIDCVRFGCDPDEKPEFYNEYDAGCQIVDVSKHTERYAGGHLHIQNMNVDDPDIYKKNVNFFPIVFDFLIGTTDVLLPKDSSVVLSEKRRLKYYGFPGRYRLQQYSKTVNGVEYRPPSNQWITQSSFVSTMLRFAEVAANICERNLASRAVDRFFTEVPALYKALVNRDNVTCKKLRSDFVTYLNDSGSLDFLDYLNIAGDL